MEDLVVDSSVLVASFVDDGAFSQQSRIYLDGLENGDYTFHLPMLVIVELISAIRRRAARNYQAMIARVNRSLADFEQLGKIYLYELDRGRLNRSIDVARRTGLRGADSIIAALAEELNLPLKTFDNEILDRFPLASP